MSRTSERAASRKGHAARWGLGELCALLLYRHLGGDAAAVSVTDADADEDIKFPDQHEEAAGWDEAEGVSVAKEGFCVECEGVCVCDISLWDVL